MGTGRRRRRAGRTQKPLSVILVDIDHLKPITTACHLAGDACLIRVAQSLQERVVRAGDLLARYGGEEFCVILPDTDSQAAHAVAEALRHKIAALNLPHPDSSCATNVSISLGVATSLAGVAETTTSLLLKADNALYRAKLQGRNCSVSHVHITTCGD
ncbi:MAG: GGDEF domain-containing protein [Pseudomonas sp.]|nr:GGDEF domain-containing protein [Pseudomonas sp.]